MSFAIFPKAFSVGFTPKAISPSVYNHPSNSPTGAEPSQAASVDKADLQFVKIIPDDLDAEVGNNLKQGTGTTRTRYKVDPESNSVVVKVVDEAGQEIRQLPNSDRLELSHRIRQYQEQIADDEAPE